MTARQMHLEGIGRTMSKANTIRKIIPFDAARYLTDDDAIAEYMSAVLEMGEPEFAAPGAGGQRCRPRSAKACKAPAPAAKPSFDSVMNVMAGLGIQMHASPAR